MKLALCFFLLLVSQWVAAADAAKPEAPNTAAPKAEAPKDEWQNTTISDEVIQKIQAAQLSYKKCAVEQMRKPDIANKQDSRFATDAVVKQCEPVLAGIRKVYMDAKVPPVIADRQLKKLRIQVTRNVLQEFMYAEAAKKAAQP
jgi:hypothetical protein